MKELREDLFIWLQFLDCCSGVSFWRTEICLCAQLQLHMHHLSIADHGITVLGANALGRRLPKILRLKGWSDSSTIGWPRLGCLNDRLAKGPGTRPCKAGGKVRALSWLKSRII